MSSVSKGILFIAEFISLERKLFKLKKLLTSLCTLIEIIRTTVGGMKNHNTSKCVLINFSIGFQLIAKFMKNKVRTICTRYHISRLNTKS